MSSRTELDDFKKNNSIKKTTIYADVEYLRDNIPTNFLNTKVILSSDSSTSGAVTLDELDTKDYYIQFNTDFQKFENRGKSLIISGTGAGDKGFTTYKVTITL